MSTKNKPKSRKLRGKIYRSKKPTLPSADVFVQPLTISLWETPMVPPVKLGDALPPETKASIESEAEARARMEKIAKEAEDCATRSSFPVLPGESMEDSIRRAGCDPEKVLANSEAQNLDADNVAEPGPLTLCDRARVAYEEAQSAAREKRHAWVANTFGNGSWEGITHNESDDTYTICGYTWKVGTMFINHLLCVERVIDVNGASHWPNVIVHDLTELGQALGSIEQFVAEVGQIPKVPTDMGYSKTELPPPAPRSFLSKLWDLLNTDLF